MAQVIYNNATITTHITNNVKDISASFKLLHDNTCVDAYTKSGVYDQMKCQEGTRKLILERLENSVAAPGNAGRLITWLDGPMGSGKTSVAVTMADRVSAKDKLIGSFIFRRGQPGRDNDSRFVATLAYQMALSIPLVRPFIEERISHDHSILQQSLSYQLDELILNPLRKMRTRNPDMDVGTLPNLIIVDGLDECASDDGGVGKGQVKGNEEQQLGVLELLHRLVLAQDVLPFAILVHSRPEMHIKHWFSMDPHVSITNRFTLDSSYNPKEDIRLYVTHGLLNLLETHPFCLHLRGTKWPYEVQITNRWGKKEVVNAIELIVEQSEGLFIYAAIGMGFISSKRHPPSERLLQILEGHPGLENSAASPYTTMDALYTQILDSISNPQVVRRMLLFNKSGLFPYSPQRDTFTHIVLFVLSISRHDFDYFLEQSASILSPGIQQFLVYHHSSLGEFLNSRERSQHWYIGNYRTEIANDIALNAFKLFSSESSVEAQRSCLAIVANNLYDGAYHLNGWKAWRSSALFKEFKGFCNFLNSSYHAAVMRVLTSGSLYDFLNQTFVMFTLLQNHWARTNHKKWISKFWSHIKALIKPHVEPYLKNPRTFAIFLCRSFGIPASNTAYMEDIPLPVSCPFDLGEILTMLVSYYSQIQTELPLYVFSIPNRDFLLEAVTILLKHMDRPSVMFSLQSIENVINISLNQFELSQGLWLAILDCDEYLTPDLRNRLHHRFFVQNLQFTPLRFRCLYYQHQYCPTPILPFQIALGKCYWEPPNSTRDIEISKPSRWFLKDSTDCRCQIVIPSVPPLARYTVYCPSFDGTIPVPKYEACCRCRNRSCFDKIPKWMRI